jgi:hypothetical protein
MDKLMEILAYIFVPLAFGLLAEEISHRVGKRVNKARAAGKEGEA